MGAPRQIHVPAQLSLFEETEFAASMPSSRSATPAAPTRPRARWLVGHAAALRVGTHSIEELLQRSNFGWIVELSGWIERRIEQALGDETIGPEFPRELFRCPARGTSPLSPFALFNRVVIGTLLGQSSLRELERLAALDLRGMWILGGWCPDHRTIGRFVAKLHGKVSQTMFEHLTVEALRAVGKRVCDVSLDGTVIAAVASRDHRLGVEAVARQKAQAHTQVQATPKDAKALDAVAHADAGAAALATLQAARLRSGNDPATAVVFPSELEAVLHKTKEGAFHPAYIASATATPDRMIVAVDVTVRDEFASVEPMLDQACAISAKVAAVRSSDTADAGAVANEASATSALPDDTNRVTNAARSEVVEARDASHTPATHETPSLSTHTIEIVRADALYLAAPVLDQEERRGIELRIAIGNLADSVVAPQGFRPDDPKAFDKFRFRLVVLPANDYAPERTCLQCPMGALLHEEGKYPPQRGAPASVRDGSVGVRCGVCPYRAKCILKSTRRTVRRYAGDAKKERMRERMTALPAATERGQRAKAIEPCFASTKGPQHLRRFRRRGLRGATLEFRLHALAHNLGRLVFLARRAARGEGRCPPALRRATHCPSARGPSRRQRAPNLARGSLRRRTLRSCASATPR